MIHFVANMQLNSSTSKDLQEKFNALFPTWTTVIATVLATLILLLVLGKFLYKPMKKMVADRKNYIQGNIDEAENQNKMASVDREKANDELVQARLMASQIVEDAKRDAEKLREANIAAAKDQANKIVSDAQIEIERDKAKFAIEAKKEMVDVALAAAKKVVEKEVDNETNRRIVEDFLKDK